jgi:aryl carrier-like protein
MTSFRPAGDKAWNYVREHAALEPYLKWIPRGPNLFECSVLDGWKALTTSNQPDKSYATKDLFEPHPTMPKAWKYIARLDDTLVLVNGEKFNPVQMEGRIRSEPSVAEAVIFGAGRPYLGLLVVPSETTKGKSREEILDLIWPTIEASNRTAEAYAHISRNMIALLPADTAYPRTDKGSIIRQAFYRDFAKQIEETYDAVETGSGNLQALDLGELKAFLAAAIEKAISKKTVAVKDDTDLFALGLDSLNAIQLRSEILRNIDVGGKAVGQNVVFDYPSVEKLSAHLLSLRTGEAVGSQMSIEEEMESLIRRHTEKFSESQQPRSSIVCHSGCSSCWARN